MLRARGAADRQVSTARSKRDVEKCAAGRPVDKMAAAELPPEGMAIHAYMCREEPTTFRFLVTWPGLSWECARCERSPAVGEGLCALNAPATVGSPPSMEAPSH